MKNSNLDTSNDVGMNQSTVIKTDVDSRNGQEKCPKCGATDISLNINSGKLRCNFCRFEFEPLKISGMQDDITKLEGQVIGSGAQDIVFDTSDVVTLKCSSCGAEVVIDTASSTQARCHWCRNILSINEQIPNGSIPDVLLPFSVSKDDSKKQIEKFVGRRKFFAHPKFKQEFTTDNIMGVYFPYMVVDINSHAKLVGQGEHLIRRYTRGSGDDSRTYYDANLYNVEREFDLTIDGLTVESSAERLSNSSSKTNNVINSIMPFDIENCVKFDSNYLKGYTSEKRDINIEQLSDLVNEQSRDIARFAANDTLEEYDRGVRWSSEELNIKGQQWKAAYLPVWLYSYQQVNGNKKLLHYVAVNARTKEVMGSVPIHMPKLLLVSAFIEILGIIAASNTDSDYSFIFLLTGIIYFLIIFIKYRNINARHKYETETKTNMSNLRKVDDFVTKKTGLTNSKINGVNNTSLSNQSTTNKIFDSIANNSLIDGFINDSNGGKNEK